MLLSNVSRYNELKLSVPAQIVPSPSCEHHEYPRRGDDVTFLWTLAEAKYSRHIVSKNIYTIASYEF